MLLLFCVTVVVGPLSGDCCFVVGVLSGDVLFIDVVHGAAELMVMVVGPPAKEAL